MFRFACSVALWGGRGAADNLTGVCGEHSQCPGHTGFTLLKACVLSPSTLLSLQAALKGAGPELRALHRPKPLRFRFAGTPQRCRLGWACVLCLPGLSSSGNQELEKRTLFRCSATSPLPGPPVSGRTSPVRLAFLLGSRSLAMTLPAYVSHPESQEVFG